VSYLLALVFTLDWGVKGTSLISWHRPALSHQEASLFRFYSLFCILLLGHLLLIRVTILSKSNLTVLRRFIYDIWIILTRATQWGFSEFVLKDRPGFPIKYGMLWPFTFWRASTHPSCALCFLMALFVSSPTQEDWRGMWGVLICRGLNPPRSPSTPWFEI
jgi:hypothetical protein